MSKQNYKVTGKAYWARVFGEPHPNYQEDGKEWSIEIALDEVSVNLVRRLGLGHRIKNKGDARGDYLGFSRPEINQTKNAPNTHITVLDHLGQPFDEDTSIGNGSDIQIKFGVFEIPPKGKFKGGPKAVIYEVKVLNLVEYKRPEEQEKPAKPDANAEESFGQ